MVVEIGTWRSTEVAMVFLLIATIVVLMAGCGDPLKEAAFDHPKPFDLELGWGESAGWDTATIRLYKEQGSSALQENRTLLQPFGELEIQGQILLGQKGLLLAYTDTFRRIKPWNDDGNWKAIRRKSIRNGCLFIETEGDRQVFTVYGIKPPPSPDSRTPSVLTGIIAPGIFCRPLGGITYPFQ